MHISPLLDTRQQDRGKSIWGEDKGDRGQEEKGPEMGLQSLRVMSWREEDRSHCREGPGLIME